MMPSPRYPIDTVSRPYRYTDTKTETKPTPGPDLGPNQNKRKRKTFRASRGRWRAEKNGLWRREHFIGGSAFSGEGGA